MIKKKQMEIIFIKEENQFIIKALIKFIFMGKKLNSLLTLI